MVVDVAPSVVLAVVKLVGKLVVVAVPTPYCIVAPLANVKVPVALPVIWKPPSDNVPDVTAKLPLTVVAAPNVAVPDALLIVRFE